MSSTHRIWAYDLVMATTGTLDDLDARIVQALAESARPGVLEVSRRLGVARGTVQARLDKLMARGALRGFGPDVDIRGIGYAVEAFTTLEIAQGRLEDVIAHLEAIPEVLEAHSISGPGDLHCRVAARTNSDLQDVLNRILEVAGIGRSTTVIALSNPLPYRVLPLVARASGSGS